MKILYTATVLSHICQFHISHLEMLQKMGHEVHVAAQNNLAVKNGLKLQHCDKFIEIPFSRSPKSVDNLKAYRELKTLLDSERYDLVICNTPMGGIVTRLAAIKIRKQGSKLIYIAHGFHFYKGAPLQNWLIFYPIEKMMSRLTDVIITITKEDYKLASKKFKTKIKHIHGIGANDKKFLSVTSEQNNQFREMMGYDRRKVILCTGELNENKNQTELIRAIKYVVKKYPDVLLLLAGNGPKEDDLKREIKSLKLEENVQLLGYCTDLEKYTNACDMVVSVSFREGMPLNIMEAMMCGKPVIASYNRGHRELIKNGINGFWVEPDNPAQICDKIIEVFEDSEIRELISTNAKKSIKHYLIENVKKELRDILFDKEQV